MHFIGLQIVKSNTRKLFYCILFILYTFHISENMPKAQQKCFEDTLQTEQDNFANGVRQITLVSRSMKMKILAGEQIRAESRFHYNGKWYDDRFDNVTCEEERFYSLQGENELGSFSLILYRKMDGSCIVSKTYYSWNAKPSIDSKSFYKVHEEEQKRQALSLTGKRKRQPVKRLDVGDMSAHSRWENKTSAFSRVVRRPTLCDL